jgi:hypothetical protein
MHIMYITACFSYDEVKLDLRNVKDSIAIQLTNGKRIGISLILQPMQCKILGEALLNAAGDIPVHQAGGSSAGSMQVDFDIQTEQEEAPCRQPSLSAPMDSASVSRIA